MIALPLLILCDISKSSGSTVLLRTSASLITTCPCSCRHLVVFHGFPRNCSKLSSSSERRWVSSRWFSRSWFIVFSRLLIDEIVFFSFSFVSVAFLRDPFKFSISFPLKLADSVRLLSSFLLEFTEHFSSSNSFRSSMFSFRIVDSCVWISIRMFFISRRLGSSWLSSVFLLITFE